MEKNEFYNFEVYQNIIQEISPCMNDYLYVYDIKQDIYSISENAVKRFAINKCCFGDVIEKHKEFVHPEDYADLKKDLIKMCSGEKETHNLTYRWIGSNGSSVWINCKGRIIRDAEQKPYLMIGCINEIGKRQGADNVSGLLGEESFFQYMKTISKLKNGFVLRIGIDKLKNINGKFGTAKGDEVLHTVAQCIKKCLANWQRVYKIIDGEFLILDFSEKGTAESAQSLYRNIRAEVDHILELQKYEILYTISGGIVGVDSLENNTDNIQKLSQFALTKATENGRNQYYCFDPKDYAQFIEGRNIAVKLRQAIANNYEGFFMVYQPIVNVKKKKLLGAEALLRFCDKNGSLIPPYKMIPVLEETGLIIPVGKWIIKTALSMCKELQNYQKDFKVTINLSYVQLKKSAIVKDILCELDNKQLNPHSLIVELTENGELEENCSIQSVWKSLKEKGVEIAVDDFGSGYSNLKIISNLQPDYVKIDREFTIRSMNNKFDFMLLANIVNMAHNLNAKFVVEGIERLDELEKINQFNPEFIQGYYFGKPVLKDEFINQNIHE